MRSKCGEDEKKKNFGRVHFCRNSAGLGLRPFNPVSKKREGPGSEVCANYSSLTVRNKIGTERNHC